MANGGRDGVRERLVNSQKCTTGCPIMDERFGGGIPCGSITEFVSEAGIGKTQFCLQLSLQAHLPENRGGLLGSCLYIHTDRYFPLARLVEMANRMVQGRRTLIPPCDTVTVQGVDNHLQLMEQLGRLEVVMENNLCVESYPFRMLVIDSVASLFRSEFQFPQDTRRFVTVISNLGRRLKHLASRFNLVVVTTNQVRDFFNATDNYLLNGCYLPELYTSGRRVVPSLGRTWGNVVETRFFLSRLFVTVRYDNGSPNGYVTRRRLHVLRSFHLGPGTVEYEIIPQGVLGTGFYRVSDD